MYLGYSKLMARILIVEDELLIGWMLADWLVELGHAPVGPAPSIAKALELIASEPLDAAILDLHLGGASAQSVAIDLRARQIPFAIASGDNVAARDGFADRPMLSKPYTFDEVRWALSTIVG